MSLCKLGLLGTFSAIAALGCRGLLWAAAVFAGTEVWGPEISNRSNLFSYFPSLASTYCNHFLKLAYEMMPPNWKCRRREKYITKIFRDLCTITINRMRISAQCSAEQLTPKEYKPFLSRHRLNLYTHISHKFNLFTCKIHRFSSFFFFPLHGKAVFQGFQFSSSD